jgi:hypothetical protein
MNERWVEIHDRPLRSSAHQLYVGSKQKIHMDYRILVGAWAEYDRIYIVPVNARSNIDSPLPFLCLVSRIRFSFYTLSASVVIKMLGRKWEASKDKAVRCSR